MVFFYQEYHLGCNLISRFYWLVGWLVFCLDFMWFIGSHRHHRHPVITNARSSFVVDRNVPRFANLDECFHCSKFLQPLWLILAIKASVSNVMGADLKSCLATFLIISWKLFLCQLLHFNSPSTASKLSSCQSWKDGPLRVHICTAVNEL